MALTLDDLLTPDTQAVIVRFILTQLSAPPKKWPVTNWGKFGAGRSLVQTIAAALADLTPLVRDIAKGGLLELAEGPWLTLLASSMYGLVRFPATFARTSVRLTCNATSGPYTITPGMLHFKTSNGQRYSSTNTANENLPTAGTLDLEFVADIVGSGGNVESTEVTITPITPLVGVTWEFLEVGGSGTPMIVTGANEEDDEDLRERCRTRWASLGVEKTRDAYVFLARNVPNILAITDPLFQQITKVFVDDTNPDGPGTIRIYLAGEGGGVNATTVAEADAYLQDRKGLCAVLVTQAALNDPVTISGLIKCRAAFASAAVTEINSRLEALRAAQEIGDGTSTDLSPGVVYRAQVLEEFMAPAGVVNAPIPTCELNALEADYVAAKGHIPTLVFQVALYPGAGESILVQAV